MSSPFYRCVGSAVTAVALSGCYDSEKNFDDFVERDNKLDRDVKVVAPGECDPTPCQRTEGNTRDFLITIAPIIDTTGTRVSLMKANITLVDGGNAMVIKAQPYAYDDPTKLVGTETVTDPIPIEPNGSFKTADMVLDVPGEANCILKDTPAQIQVRLEGCRVCDETAFACGLVFGKTIAPIVDLSLDNSTFAAQEFVDGKPPAPVKNCEMESAPAVCPP
jgi:hypothetical protein